MDYETKRDQFDRIVKAYKEYINLYRFVNNGEIDGVSDFGDFYMRFTFYGRYNGSNEIQSSGN